MKWINEIKHKDQLRYIVFTETPNLHILEFGIIVGSLFKYLEYIM